MYRRLEAIRTHLKEVEDCTVCALAVAGRMSYSKAHKILEDAGREPKQGMDMDDMINTYKTVVGFTPITLIERWTIQEFIALVPLGTYVLITLQEEELKGHIFPVIDGVAHDFDAIAVNSIVVKALTLQN